MFNITRTPFLRETMKKYLQKYKKMSKNISRLANVICETTGSTLNLKGVNLNLCGVNHTLWGVYSDSMGVTQTLWGLPWPNRGWSRPDRRCFKPWGIYPGPMESHLEPMWVTRTSQGSPRPHKGSPRPHGGHPDLMGVTQASWEVLNSHGWGTPNPNRRVTQNTH